MALRDTFEHPCVGADKVGEDVYLESILGGLSLESENHVGTAICEDMRTFIPQPRFQGVTPTTKQQSRYTDVMAADIMRARDFGVPSYNDLRRMFDLDEIITWEDLTDDPYYLRVLPLLYDNVDELDGYIGGLIESVEASFDEFKDGSGHVGPLFARIARDQYLRLIQSDRLFYEWNSTLKAYVSDITLSDVIMRNTELKNLSTDVMIADAKSYYAQPDTTTGAGLCIFCEFVII